MTANTGVHRQLSTHRAGTWEYYERTIANAVLQMTQDPSDELDLKTLARTSGMSKYHFLRVFEAVTSVSPKRFLAAIRLHHAKALLLETSLSITDVMLEAGYSSTASFTRTFSEYVGAGPTAFRKRYAEIAGLSIGDLTAKANPRIGETVGGRSLTIRITRSGARTGPIFVGLFQEAVPRRRPIVGTMIEEDEVCVLPVSHRVDRGFILAAGFHQGSPMKCYFLPTSESVIVGSAMVPLGTSDDWTSSSICLELHRPRIFDPPILIALPLLLAIGGRAQIERHA